LDPEKNWEEDEYGADADPESKVEVHVEN